MATLCTGRCSSISSSYGLDLVMISDMVRKGGLLHIRFNLVNLQMVSFLTNQKVFLVLTKVHVRQVQTNTQSDMKRLHLQI